MINILEQSGLIWAGSLVAGFLGALTGLGGGVVIVPLMTLVFGVDIRYAIGASLVAVVATSSGAASAYVRDGYTNLRIGIFLVIATALGAIFGAMLAAYLSTAVVAVIFGLVLLVSAFMTQRPREQSDHLEQPDRWADALQLGGSYPGRDGPVAYRVRRVPLGFGLMLIAGALSGLLGIGSGAAKVLAMDHAMRLPFKVSTTTSNFMIGVTAVASVGIYLGRGYIDPGLTMPVVLGVLPGALLGARFLVGTRSGTLRLIFRVIILLLGLQMIYNAFTGRI